MSEHIYHSSHGWFVDGKVRGAEKSHVQHIHHFLMIRSWDPLVQKEIPTFLVALLLPLMFHQCFVHPFHQILVLAKVRIDWFFLGNQLQQNHSKAVHIAFFVPFSMLAGAVLLAPVVNYRWPGFPKNISAEGYYYMQEAGDRWPLMVAYYTPWLLNWWLKQPWQPTPTVFKDTTFLPNRLDAMLRDHRKSTGLFEERLKLVTQQGIHESLYRDILVMFGKWEFDPMDLPPAPVHVHLWQGDEDGLVPVSLQRYISSRLPWITYHELPITGHFLSAVPGFGDNLLKTVLLQQLN